MAPITAVYAGPLALLFLWLSARVILHRRSLGVSLGAGGDATLERRMRAQANCAEYLPIGLILLGLAEVNGAPGWALHLLGLMLLAGRVAHGVGFTFDDRNMTTRVAGTALTQVQILLAALLCLAAAF